jgi:hypothetical protein
MILYIENPKVYTHSHIHPHTPYVHTNAHTNMLGLISELLTVPEYKLSIQNPVIFLCTHKEQPKSRIKKIIPG